MCFFTSGHERNATDRELWEPLVDCLHCRRGNRSKSVRKNIITISCFGLCLLFFFWISIALLSSVLQFSFMWVCCHCFSLLMWKEKSQVVEIWSESVATKVVKIFILHIVLLATGWLLTLSIRFHSSGKDPWRVRSVDVAFMCVSNFHNCGCTHYTCERTVDIACVCVS